MPGSGEVGHLVLPKSGGAKALPGALIHPRLVLGIEPHPALGQLDPQGRVLLERQAVGR